LRDVDSKELRIREKRLGEMRQFVIFVKECGIARKERGWVFDECKKVQESAKECGNIGK
jgi:hypothetical protein